MTEGPKGDRFTDLFVTVGKQHPDASLWRAIEGKGEKGKPLGRLSQCLEVFKRDGGGKPTDDDVLTNTEAILGAQKRHPLGEVDVDDINKHLGKLKKRLVETEGRYKIEEVK